MQASKSSNTPLRAGIVGLGRSGWDIHAAALSEHPGFRVVAAADPEQHRRDEAMAQLGCATYAEPAGVLHSDEVDVVVVATPSHIHYPLTLEALAAGRHVVVEKPMAQSLREVDDMTAAAARAERVLTCFQQRRLESVLTTTQDVLASGRLGRLVAVRCIRNQFMRRTDWQTLRKFGGGALASHGTHLIDQMMVLLGDGPVEVFADLQHTVGAGDAEDHIKICLRGSSGVVADIEYSLCAAFPRHEWEVVATAGSIRRSGNKLEVRWLDVDSLGSLTADEGPAADRSYHTGEELVWHDEILDISHDEGSLTRVFYDKLHATLTAGAPLFVTPESVRQQFEIIEAARAVARRQVAGP